jgi:hypothetical protein
MNSQLLVLSNQSKDIEFWRQIAEKEGLGFRATLQLKEIERLVRQQPDALILWDGQCEQLQGLDRVLLEAGVGARVFVVTDGPARSYPHLFAPPVFSHHLNRRYDESAEFLCTQLIRKVLGTPAPFESYFKDVIIRKSVILTHSLQKGQVIEDFYKTLIENRVIPRIAEIGADAADEFLMNAIFDAPRDSQGLHYRRKLERDANFRLTFEETVEIELVISHEFIGIRVIDKFGSLDPNSAKLSLGKNFDNQGYELPIDDPGAGLGLLKLSKSAMSLAFFVNPGHRTESIAIFRNTRKFSDLRQSFCFFSVQSDVES